MPFDINPCDTLPAHDPRRALLNHPQCALSTGEILRLNLDAADRLLTELNRSTGQETTHADWPTGDQ